MKKQKSNQINILGKDVLCLKGGLRKLFDKQYPELKGVKLNLKHMPKVKEFLKKNK